MSKTLIERIKQEELSRWEQDKLIPYADIIRSKSRFNYKKFKEFIGRCVSYMNEYPKFIYDWNEKWLDFDPKLKMAKLKDYDMRDYSMYLYTLEFHIPLKYEKDIKWVTRSFKELKKLFNPYELGKLILNLEMPEPLTDAFLLNFIIKQKGILSFWGSPYLSDFICRSSEKLIGIGRGKTKEEAKRNYIELKRYFI